jgi:outer membrane protein OmpU
MNNLKKVGLTALAGSLALTSAYAGEVTVAGGASMTVQHVNGGAANAGKTFKMGNQLTFTGGGELDNGLNVSISFVLDQGDDSTGTAVSSATAVASNGPFDSHSITVSSDSWGSLTMAGEGGSSAQAAVDTTAAGDLWDSTLGITTAQDPFSSAGASGMLIYSLPSLMDGLAINASYTPKGTGADNSTAYALIYTGVEGLSLTYASGTNNATAGGEDTTKTMKASYAYGPVTVGWSSTEHDSKDNGAGGDNDQEVDSYSISYTVSDSISLSYGQDTISEPLDTDDADIEVSGITASYTAGGMTISAAMISADNVDMVANSATNERDKWSLSASFAF